MLRFALVWVLSLWRDLLQVIIFLNEYDLEALLIFMADVIQELPGKTLHYAGTIQVLRDKLAFREIGFCTTDHKCYIKDLNGDLVVLGSEGFTPEEWAAIQSGITDSKLEAIENAISNIPQKLSDLDNDTGYISDVDTSLSPTSENPVQNKVIYEAIGNVEALLAAL